MFGKLKFTSLMWNLFAILVKHWLVRYEGRTWYENEDFCTSLPLKVWCPMTENKISGSMIMHMDSDGSMLQISYE